MRAPVTVAFATLGCRLNQVESQELGGLLESRGFRVAGAAEPAQVYVVNTCTVTGKADFSDRQAIRQITRNNPAALLVVTGCYAQTNAQAVARIPGVDLVLGNADKYRLPELLADLLNRPRLENRGPEIRVRDIAAPRDVPVAPFVKVTGRTRAFVRIQDGCQHRCAFCIVPLARGGSRSQEPKVVVDQVHRLVEGGYGEVVLTGVDMGHHGWDLFPRTTLATLLRQILDVPGLGRLRLSSILPPYFTDELIEVIAGSPRIAPHLHIPLQSGSNRVLGLMRRPYNTRIYGSLVERLSRAIPDLGLGADVIVGFPGETDADFEATRALIGALPVSYLHVFSYSDRQGTEAARLPGHLPARTITERSKVLRRLGREKSLAFRRRQVGRTWEVLVLEERDKSTGRLSSLTGNYVEILFDGTDEWMGRFLNVSVTDATSDRTLGKVAEPSSEA